VGRDEGNATVILPKALGWLAERGFDPIYGSRTLKRLIQKEMVDKLSLKLLEGKIHEGPDRQGRCPERRAYIQRIGRSKWLKG